MSDLFWKNRSQTSVSKMRHNKSFEGMTWKIGAPVSFFSAATVMVGLVFVFGGQRKISRIKNDSSKMNDWRIDRKIIRRNFEE